MVIHATLMPVTRGIGPENGVGGAGIPVSFRPSYGVNGTTERHRSEESGEVTSDVHVRIDG